MKYLFLTLFLAIFSLNIFATDTVFVININEEINSKMWVYTQKGMKEAKEANADLIIIHLNTYGGELSFADSIRTKLLNSKIPVIAFIDNNAASAGALISLACNRIYMRKGASIGAATVVNGIDGAAMPDKYQSYMRSMMRSTAEAHGKNADGQWIRDPLIAEAMVDPRTVVPEIDDSAKTLTLTTLEAIKYRYCEGEAENISQVLEQEKINDYQIITFKPSFWDSAKGLLTSSVLRGLLITLIIAGIWFELQQPGIGFPLILAVGAAILYFAPLYIDGLAANWEILVFLIGVVLLILEIFVIPGFGIAGISGIILIFIGLTFSLLDNDFFNFSRVPNIKIGAAVLTVTAGIIIGFVLMMFVSSKIGSKGVFNRLALNANQKVEEGFVGVPTEQMSLKGEKGKTVTDLRPAGKVQIGNQIYDAVAEQSKFIAKNTDVEVSAYGTGQILVRKITT